MIAVVDDDASVRKALDRLLRAAGLETATYATGQAFLDSCEDTLPECVVIDMHMPDLSGLEVQRRLNDAGYMIPVIMITADDEAWHSRGPRADGISAWLSKPVDGPNLISHVEQIIGETGSSRARRGARAACGMR